MHTRSHVLAYKVSCNMSVSKPLVLDAGAGLVARSAHEVGAQVHTEVVGAGIEAEHGNVEALLSPRFAEKLFCVSCGACAGVYTCGHRVAHSRRPSPLRRALVSRLALRVVYSV